jgi:small-conductance mechanosensitive channel
VLAHVEGGVTDPGPTVLFRAFGPTGVELSVRLPVREYPSQGPVRHELVKRLHRRFAREGIAIPHPLPPPPGLPPVAPRI